MKPFWDELWDELRPYVRYLAGFSLLINLLYLAPAMFSLQVFDRVLSSNSPETLIMLLLGTGAALLLMLLLDFLSIHFGLADFDKVDLTAYGHGATISTALDAAGTGSVVTVHGAGVVNTFTVLNVNPAVFDQSDCIFA